MFSKLAPILLTLLVTASSTPAEAQSKTERLRNKTMDAANNSNSPSNAANAVDAVEKGGSDANGVGTHAGVNAPDSTAGNNKKTSTTKVK
jgi:hypothetical protein